MLSSRVHLQVQTSRERHKSAPYPAISRHIQGSKTAKGLPSVKYSLLQYSKNQKNFEKNSKKPRKPENQKNRNKSLTMSKKTGEGPFWIFQHPFCRKTSNKLKGGPFGEKFQKKSRSAEKKI